MNFVRRFHSFLLAIAIAFVAVVYGSGFLTSSPAERAGSLSNIIGAFIGVVGAAAVVFLSLNEQKKEDKSRIQTSVLFEVIQLMLSAEALLNSFCQILADPKMKASWLHALPAPVIFPAVADRIGLAPAPRSVINFYFAYNTLVTVAASYAPTVKEMPRDRMLILVNSALYVCLSGSKVLSKWDTPNETDQRTRQEYRLWFDQSIARAERDWPQLSAFQEIENDP